MQHADQEAFLMQAAKPSYEAGKKKKNISVELSTAPDK